jgi:hypothetical protein
MAELKKGKRVTGGNRGGDRAWIEEVGDEIHPADPKERPEGFLYDIAWQWDGDAEEVNPDFFLPYRRSQNARRCTGIAFIRDETGTYIVDRNWQRLVRPCLATPIKGGSVCQSHGGRLVQVKAAAERVIAQASEIVALRLVGLTAAQDENKVFIDHKVRLGAANSVLDRAGVKGGMAAEENSIPGYRKVLDALFADDSAEEGDE